MERIQLICEINICFISKYDLVIFFRNKFLHKFKVPGEFCTYFNHLNCDNKTDFRTPTGVCNNFKHRYQGSSQTAFGRILPPAYDDCML
jgi:hypothetical protein